MDNKFSLLAKELFAKLNKSSEIKRFENKFSKNIVEVAAVTGASGVSAGKSGEDTMWTASIDLIAWKELNNNDSVIKKEVRMQWLVTDHELQKSRERIAENSILRLQVRKSADAMMLIKIIETDYRDSELETILQDSMKPVYFDDERLGQFELDKTIKVFETKTDWAGEDCSLYFDWDENMDIQKNALETAYVLFQSQDQWNKKIRDFASEELLDLANDWLQDNEDTELTEITKSMFIDFMSLDSISVYPEGEFEMYFADGDMFWGHTIIVSGNINGVFTSAEIAG